jgi:hypothetical protein
MQPINNRVIVRVAATLGMAGPLLLGGAIAALTWLERDFMRGLGWDPIGAPTLDWPSGLALGPYGGIMEAAFIGSGMGMIIFAAGLQRGVAHPKQWSGPALLAVAGGALMLLASKTDPTLSHAPPTWHGRLHDAAFVLLGMALLPAMLLLARRFRHDPAWRGHAGYTLATLLLAAPAFVLKGLAFYVFLAAMLLWVTLTAARLWRGASVQQ